MMLFAAMWMSIKLVALPPVVAIEARLLHTLDENVMCGRACDELGIHSFLRIVKAKPDLLPRLDSARASLERRAIWEKR